MQGFITQYSYGYDMVVLSVDSVLIKGQYRNRWNFNQINNIYPYVIEGIGSSFGLIEPVNRYNIDFTYRYLVCVKDSLNTLFVSDYNSAMDCNLIYEGLNELNIENSISWYPNPFSTLTTLKTDKIFKNATLIVFNSYGQKVKQTDNLSGHTIIFYRDNLQSGLYFFRLFEAGNIIATDKLLITNN